MEAPKPQHSALRGPSQRRRHHGRAPCRARRRRRPGRRLSQEERLVLGILGDPRFGFAALTALPYDGSI
jgi:hypothetical protein